ncbi:Las1-like-domain-containing protein [Amylostereum chailletii]|nr:Las1-like-domain-containing protein [Amylostereum chailletii]
MRIPQKTPWISLVELDELCSWIYSDTADCQSKTLAMQRLSAWKTVTALLHALESILSILVVILQDEKDHTSSTSSLFLRQSYATALIRLVNGLVDPLQVGAYARSIASIAAQMGLPVWLVELRHAATHEDMPSLELLREAAHESMDWLLHNYLLPTLNPAGSSNQHIAPLRPIAPLLAQYKFLMKAVTKDTTLLSHYQADINKVLRDVERWVAEARVDVDVSTGEFGWTGQDSGNDEEAWALEQLSEELIQRGVLVPVSRKKRALPKGVLHTPSVLIALWEPLLQSLESHHSTFTSTLLTRSISRLLSRPKDSSTESDSQPSTLETTSDHVSYEMCLASWVMWLLRPRPHRAVEIHTAKQDAFTALAVGLGPQTGNTTDFPGAWALLKALCESNDHLDAVSKSILTPTGEPCAVDQPWKDDDIQIMDKRLNKVLAVPNDFAHGVELSDVAGSAAIALDTREGNAGLPLGWRIPGTESNWRPCPMGIYIAA